MLTCPWYKLPYLTRLWGPSQSGVNVPSSAEEMLFVQRLQDGKATTGLPSGRLVIRSGELSITFGPQFRHQDGQLDDELWQV
jgi:hypothetical protein